MRLLATPEWLAARRAVVAGPGAPLEPLATSLAADLEPLMARGVFVPPEKARMTRSGGRCSVDGAMLDFDPFRPRTHRCPVCGATYGGEDHYRWWIYWYQLWLAERAVHAALLHAVGRRAEHAALARTILETIAARYEHWPNRDNVLGPTRPFFSTYLESIWLLQLAVAVDLLEAADDTSGSHARLGARFRDRVVEPSAALIAGYDEGMSNRQVWNGAALLAAARLLGRDDDVDRLVNAPSGLLAHLRHGLLADGTWYEGENYHLFAHRGLWYGVQLAERAGVRLPDDLRARYDEAFATPLLVALPDLTLPSRRDSQYAISLRQWRVAELCELGLARRDDARIAAVLAALYGADVPRRDTGRARSAAEAERNLPPTALSRADLGWKSLLFARATTPAAAPTRMRSVLLPSQGLGVLRRGAKVYAALDYGESGGGHGHPDRLNLLLHAAGARWLDDMGTGSYVDASLHWYRSSLAHNAPFVDGRSQQRIDGSLVAFEDRDAAGWIVADAEVAPGVRVRRTVVVVTGYALDVVEWRANRHVTFDLPWHVDATLAGSGVQPQAASLEGSLDLEDGFRFVRAAARTDAEADALVKLVGREGDASLALFMRADQPLELWRALAPAAPGQGARHFWLARSRGEAGVRRAVLDWSSAVADVQVEDDRVVVHLADGSRHEHVRTDDGWRVDLFAGGARSSIDLGGRARGEPAKRATPAPAPAQTLEPLTLPRGREHRISLGEADYRRSEESWREAGSPTADVGLTWTGAELRLRITVPQSDRTFVPAGAANPLDNEHADVNGDGVQLYADTGSASGGWMLVPDAVTNDVRVRPLDGWGGGIPLHGTWRVTTSGYEMQVVLGIDGGTAAVALAVIVNEKPAGRERRRGQLVLGGAAGEFVYLRGDRHPRTALVPFALD